ncbi:MAG: hypothetical protein LBD58_06365 [Treponema sp.]|jgi:hypothetical protein|nr:hypothetical protein [Treponema sp.]
MKNTACLEHGFSLGLRVIEDAIYLPYTALSVEVDGDIHPPAIGDKLNIFMINAPVLGAAMIFRRSLTVRRTFPLSPRFRRKAVLTKTGSESLSEPQSGKSPVRTARGCRQPRAGEDVVLTAYAAF